MQFDLDEEQAEIRATVRSFVVREITPHAAEWDEDYTFPRTVYTQMAEIGLMGMTIPEEYQGNMLSRLTGTLVYEELAKGDMATAVGLSVHNMVAGTLARFASEEQRHWVTQLAAGKLLGAFSLSEVASGSDAASLQCQAVRTDDTYRINGTKAWVTNGGEADLYLLMARHDPTITDRSAISCFIVEKGTPGFTFGKSERKMGLHASPTRELIFTDCIIPVTNRIGGEGQGFKIALSALDGGRINIAAIAVGVAQAAFEMACSYACQRTQFSQPIGAFQGIQFMLADMAMRIEAARLLVYEAAYKLDTGQSTTLAAAMAKCFASDMAMEATTNAVQILGGAGYIHDYPVERYMRDVKVAQIFEGTNQIQRIVIARALLGSLTSTD